MNITPRNLIIVLVMATVGFYITTALVKNYGN